MANILIVDDEQGFRATLARFAEKEGHLSHVASDATQAFEVLENHGIDILVSDIIMPGISGIELMKNVRHSHPNLKIILITGEPTLEGATDAVRSGAFDYLTKPVSRHTFCKTINTAAKIKRLEDQHRNFQAELEKKVKERTYQLRSYQERLVTIAQDTRLFIFCESEKQLAEKALALFSQSTKAHGGCFYFVENDRLRLLHALDEGHQEPELPLPLKGSSVLATIMDSCKPLLVNDISKESSLEPSGWQGYRNGSTIAFPCEDGNGKLWAVVVLHDKENPPFAQEDVELGRIIVSHTIESLRQIELKRNLSESEQKYRLLVEGAHDVVFQVSLEGEMLYCSPAVERFGGYKVEDVIGQNAFEYIYLDSHKEKAVAQIQRLLEEGTSHPLEVLYKPAEGKPFWVEIVGNLIVENGVPTGVHSIMRNISERKHLEEAYRSLAEESLQGLSIFQDNKVVYVNRTLASFIGWSVEEAIGLPVEEFARRIHREDRGQVIRKHMALIEGKEEASRVEYRIVNKDGGIRWIESFATRIIFNGSKAIQVTYYEITERKEAEENLSQLVAAIENADEEIIITDLNATIQFVNPAFERITGYTKEEAIGQNPRFLQGGKNPPEFYADLWTTILAGDIWRGRFINRCKDGRLITEESVISPIRNASGVVTGYVSIKRDITKQIQLEEQFRQAQKMEALGTLAGGIAHDFNNLLSVILGNIQIVMMEDISEDSQIYNDLDLVLQAAERAKDLVQQILAFSRRSKKERRSIEITSLIKETVKLLRATLPSTIEIHQDLRALGAKILGDPTEIHQIVMNLSTNAAHAMEPAGGILSLHLARFTKEADENGPEGRFIELVVSDTGCGIDPAIKDRIFDPFFTTKAIGKGTGLGLAAVHGIVESLGGSIQIDSEKDEGTQVRILFPTIEDPEVETVTRKTTLSAGHESVLFVDDERSILHFAQKLLSRLGYKVILAENGEEALRIYQENQGNFDLVISDMTMPVMTGVELARKIREIDPNQRFLFGTGNAVQDREHEEMTDVQVLSKPYDIERFVKTIREILDEKEKLPV